MSHSRGVRSSLFTGLGPPVAKSQEANHHGAPMELTERLVLTQDQFDAFARLSGDDNPIHVDPEFAARTRFGRTVAHGMMLFGLLTAATARRLERPLELARQNLVFLAPTYAGDEHTLTIRIEETDPNRARVDASLHASDGTQTVSATASFGPGSTQPDVTAVPRSDVDRYRGMTLGSHASRSRTFTHADVERYCALVGEPAGHLAAGVVPPPLLAATVSCLLGTDLPGRGTNWLKQSFQFSRTVQIGQDVLTTVEVVRFRPGKHLVNLASSISTSRGITAEGLSLVHTRDIATSS
ncbi:MAG: MaoC family dehydratase N-terminal domain-containing protein [Acidimicrobiia bacterium]|nr:MaoC family dehydratase N-terminal domain-containing protein [Acidimicrobiia bacterium]